MFVDFFFHLRNRGIPASTTEFLSLLEALQRGLVDESLDRFYAIARALLVKKPEHFDLYDLAFYEFFKDRPFSAESVANIEDQILQWLANAKLRDLSPEEIETLLEGADALSLDELREQFMQRLQEQEERHDGGSHWVGTGGTSPFGHGGVHPGGVRVGGSSNLGRAMQVAQKRRFANLREDLRLDTRQISVALRKLRELTREGREDELDLEATIDETAKNAGDLEIIMRAPRKNRVKLLLLMDVGGSMAPYGRLCSLLFSAAHQANHFKAFKSYYFHNCPYEKLYEDMAQRKGKPSKEILRNLDKSWRTIIVGDAAMAPSELMVTGGSIDYFHINRQPGIYWLNRIKEITPRAIWLNPDPPRYWGSWTTQKIRELYPMYPLTLDGLEEAVRKLRYQRI